MIAEPLHEVEKRAKTLARMMKAAKIPAKVEVKPCESQIGGGSLPLERIPSMAVIVKPEKISVNELEERLRHLPVPVIPRTANDTVILDARTIQKHELRPLVNELVDFGVLEEKSLVKI